MGATFRSASGRLAASRSPPLIPHPPTQDRLTMDRFQPRGVIPACLLPFDDDLRIDEATFRRHLGDLAAVDGISAITVNGHASEVHALSFDEQARVLRIAREALQDRTRLIAGVFTSNWRQAAEIARMADHCGADALLVFPSEIFSLGGQARPEMAVAHFDAIASATDLPMVLFQYPLAGGMGYPLETLVMLCERYPTIAAIKDWCQDPALHERQIRTLHSLPRPVRVLTTHSAWLLPSLVLGCDGILSGAGSVIADLHVALWRAVQGDDLAQARRIHDRIYPTTRAFYREPLVDMHNRMKEALVLLGRLPRARVRAPLVPLSAEEKAQIAELLLAAGLTPETVYHNHTAPLGV